MPSKRGISKKFNAAKCFTSPRKIDKRSRRQRCAAKRNMTRNAQRLLRPRLGDKKSNQLHRRHGVVRERLLSRTKARTENIRQENTVPITNNPSKPELRTHKTLQPKPELSLDCKQLRKQRQVHNAAQPSVPTGVSQSPKHRPHTESNIKLEQKSKPKPVRVFALGQFRQLLQVVAPGSLVVLDIDETLIVTRHTPSLLLEPSGVRRFQKYVTDTFPDFETRNMHCRRLQGAMMDKTLVEDDTANVIRELQRKNCRVFALTARYAQLAERTNRVLGSLGISFKESAPFPSHPIKDPVTGVIVMDGIVYCNGEDKGRILSRLLSGVILPRERKAATLHGQPFDEANPALPGLHFVDDRLEHTLSVRDSLKSFPSLISTSICFHYRSPRSLSKGAEKSFADAHPRLLSFIMSYFVKHERVLSNVEALRMFEEAESRI